MSDPRTKQVIHLITDYTRDNKYGSVEHVRIPERSLNKHIADLRDANTLNANFRELLQGQAALVHEQSQNLDAQADKYEQLIKLMEEREHEIILLVHQNNELTKELQGQKQQLENYEITLAGNQKAEAHAEVMSQRYDELRGNMQSLRTAHELEMDQKDAEIANLRQKLGSCREEVFARREDVKNVVAQTQAMLQVPSEPRPTTAKGSGASKALKFFGMERDKYKKGGLPVSQSHFGLSSVDVRYSSKEVAPAVSKETLRHRTSWQAPGECRSIRPAPDTPPTYPQDRSPLARHPVSEPSRPAHLSLETLSLQRPAGSNVTSPVSPANRYKPLPENPMTLPQFATARLASVTSPKDSPLEAQIASDYLSHGIMGQTSQTARRVLSKITEVSTPPKTLISEEEGSVVRLRRVAEDNSSDHSVSSSDREVYRKSISALHALNTTSGLPYAETETDFERAYRSAVVLGEAPSPPPRNNNRRVPAATCGNQQQQQTLDGESEGVQTGVARVLHLRQRTRDLRRPGGTHDGLVEEDSYGQRRQFGTIGEGRVDRPINTRDRDSSGESNPDRRERFHNPARESIVSTVSSGGYRTEDSEPKTVAELYHSGGAHIRG